MIINFDNFETIAKTIAKERRQTETLRCCHVAFILNKSRIVSIGVNNLTKTHTLNRKYKYPERKSSICAELSAVIRGRKEDYSGHRIVVIRVDRNDKLNYSHPCPGCQNLIRAMNFKETLFTNKEGELEVWKD